MKSFFKLNKLLRFNTYKFSQINKFKSNFLSPSNLVYIESEYEKWQNNKKSVPTSFQIYFQLIQKGVDIQKAFQTPPQDNQRITIVEDNKEISNSLRLRLLIDGYRLYGHQFAKTDPLEFHTTKHGSLDKSILHYTNFGFSEKDLQYQFDVKQTTVELDDLPNKLKLKDLIQYLQKVYCNKVGFEYMHLTDKEQRRFLRDKLQNLTKITPTKQEKIQTFKRLCQDQSFTEFLGKKFANYKRFGVQGLNAVTSALGQLVNVAVRSGTQYITLGMAHRGRLNILHCVFNKSQEVIFQEFLQKKQQVQGSSGDVKYHLGLKKEKSYGDKKIQLSIVPNPSHLEAVDPLVYGRVRAIQDRINDKTRTKSLGVLIHGDAAVAGQGVVYESIQMQDLHDYTTGGIIHIVMNNQIGFTTNQIQSRSTYYCTEIAKVVNAPVFHVNSDEPDLIDKCMEIAIQYRQKFKKDIFIDIIGYRKYGHNEQDQPLFTQPLMYEKIKHIHPVYEKYCNRLIQQNVLTKQEINTYKQTYLKRYQESYKNAIQKVNPEKVNSQTMEFQKLLNSSKWGINTTGVNFRDLDVIFQKLMKCPADFNIHPKIFQIYQERIRTYLAERTFIANQKKQDLSFLEKSTFLNTIKYDPQSLKKTFALDWASMQMLAFATLLDEGYSIRLSGQDVQRGTFSHRHATINDQKNDRPKYLLFKNISKNVSITNSHLSEYGVMGFQYGYSITNANCLVIWQAQFGDFTNGAQIIIDNFLTCAQTKWGQQSGLVLNLPHGMDGQGPQHSSARIQRFLQASDDNNEIQISKLTSEQELRKGNMQIAYCSTSSNYFHILRRQLKRNYRKPLVLFNSKKLLKFKLANSSLKQIDEGTTFSPIYGEVQSQKLVSSQQIKTVLICSGQFYYQLRSKREQTKKNDIVIIRVEQLAPFPHNELQLELKKYPNAQFIWVQEQHQNQGAWNYMHPRLRNLLNKLFTNKKQIFYCGRRPSAASACGTLKGHKSQEAQILKKIFITQ